MYETDWWVERKQCADMRKLDLCIDRLREFRTYTSVAPYPEVALETPTFL